MEKELLNKIGVDIEELYKEPLHTRDKTMEILGVSNKTLKRYEDKNILHSNKFKRRKYYSTKSILNCIKTQLGLYNQNEDWVNIWD